MEEACCLNHHGRRAVVCCPRGRAFCRECLEATELRSGVCGYCPHHGDCPIQQEYRRPSGVSRKLKLQA